VPAAKLAAIAVIRTALNYFLNRDMQEVPTGAKSLENMSH
jgi:uncharacterized membrane protein